MSARISVALPVFNGANYIREALDSVLSQDFGDFDLVVSDNRSTDATPRILDEYARRDRRVRVSRSELFLSQAENVNRAVDLCDAPWVKLLCHDDLMVTGCLGALAASVADLDGSSVGLVGNAEEWLFGNGYRHRAPDTHPPVPFEAWSGPDFVRRVMRGRAPAPIPSLTTAMVRKEAWRAAGEFDPRFVHFDIFLWLRLLVDWDYRFVPAVLTTNRIHGAQVAIDARKSQRSVADQRAFWRQFARENRARLDLGWSDIAKANLKPLGTAGAHIAIELILGRPAAAIAMARRLPAGWLPLLPLFVARSARAERRKIRELVRHVPIELIYPG